MQSPNTDALQNQPPDMSTFDFVLRIHQNFSLLVVPIARSIPYLYNQFDGGSTPYVIDERNEL